MFTNDSQFLITRYLTRNTPPPHNSYLLTLTPLLSERLVHCLIHFSLPLGFHFSNIILQRWFPYPPQLSLGQWPPWICCPNLPDLPQWISCHILLLLISCPNLPQWFCCPNLPQWISCPFSGRRRSPFSFCPPRPSACRVWWGHPSSWTGSAL